jgi:hypothetical protein
VRDEPQNRPPWLRSLRPRHEVEQAKLEPAPASDASAIGAGRADISLEASPQIKSLNRRFFLFLILLLWMNISVLGCLFLLATQRVVL